MITRDKFTQLTGADPVKWFFKGQCYDSGLKSNTVCKITGRKTRYCFILKTKDNVLKMTVGKQAFPIIKKYNPDLYEALYHSEKWLMTMVRAELHDKGVHGMTDERRAAEKAWRELKQKAFERLRDYRRTTGERYLPKPLFQLKEVVEKTIPVYKRPQSTVKWFQNQAMSLEALLDVSLTVAVRRDS